MSSNDFNGPYRPAGGRGAGRNSRDARDAGRGGNRGRSARSNGEGYAPPEGWGDDGFWRDSSVDANYETGAQQALGSQPLSDPGRGSYPRPGGDPWSGGAAQPGAGRPGTAQPGTGRPGTGRSGTGPRAAFDDSTRLDNGPAIGPATRLDQPAIGDPTRIDRMPPGGPRPGGPGGPPRRPGPGGRPPGGPGRRPGSGGPRPPRSKSWWKTWTWKKALLVGGGTIGGLVIVLFLAGFIGYSMTTIPAAFSGATQQDSIVYFSNGTEMGTIGTTNRTDLPLNQIPVTLQDAFLAAEDKNFYHEGGVSFEGILRAAADDVTSGGGSLNGGSTITQEFVRNYYGLGLQQTASRKIKEIFISEKLSHAKSKQWILDHYLNLVYLGEDSYGVEAAAETYFGKPASKLTIGQEAILAGLPQSPSEYPLPQYKANLKARWQYVMTQMVKDGFITQQQASAQKFPTLLTWTDPTRGEMASNVNPANGNEPWEPYLLDAVENELINSDHVTQGELNSGGFRITTTIDETKEQDLYNAVNQTLSSSSLHANGSQFSTLPAWALVGAEAQNPANGAIVAMYPGKGQDQSAAQCKENDCYENTVTQAKEQVGSSFKPYVLATAVKQGMNVQTSILDTSPYACIAPASVGSTVYSQPVTQAIYKQATANPPTYAPCPTGFFPEENDDGEIIGRQVGQAYQGPYAGAPYYSDSVQDALAQSSNVAFTDLIHKTGTIAVENLAGQFGVNTAELAPYASKGEVGMALGIASMTVQEQASMIAAIDDNGTYHTPHLIASWQDSSGDAKHMPVITTRQVLTPAQDSQVQYAMMKTTVDGTAASVFQDSAMGQRTILGKTGTTTSNHSGFFIGGIPQFAMAVGMFTSSGNNNSTDNLGMLNDQDAANLYPTMIWNSFANAAYGNTAPESFQSLNTTGTTKWDLLGPVPKAKPKTKPKTNPSKAKTNPVKGSPTPTVTPTLPGFGATPTATPTPSSTCQGLLCGQPQPTSTDTTTPPPGNGNGNGNGGSGGGGGGNAGNDSDDG